MRLNMSGLDVSYENLSSLPSFSQMAVLLSSGYLASLPLMPLTTTRIEKTSVSGGLMSYTSKAPPLIIEYGSSFPTMLPVIDGGDGTTATRPSVERVLLRHLLPMRSEPA